MLASHGSNNAFADFQGRTAEGLVCLDRRGMLKASFAGLAGLSVPELLRVRAEASRIGQETRGKKSVILLWMAGGPSHIDTWDPKPNRPYENRGPFGVIQSKLPGVQICEHLPKQAAMLDKFTIIRSVDPRNSNHEPNKVFQTGNLEASPRTNPKGDLFPSIGSVVAKHHGANLPGMPPYVAFQKSRSHVAWAGYLGKRYDPFLAQQAARLPVYDLVGNNTGKISGGNLFNMPLGLDQRRIYQRKSLLDEFDRMRSGLDLDGSMDALDTYSQQAVDMVLGQSARDAFDISREPEESRQRYGDHLWCQQVLLARRLIEAGVSFVTIDLSYHTASGTWDNHGIPGGVYGGISSGLRPLLPTFDHIITTLVSDLEERGRLDDVLIIAMGEFGRTPQIGTQESTDGRNHWTAVMSMCLAGGGYRHGQVIGASESDGGSIRERAVTPGDLAATIYRHMGVPLDTRYEDERQIPRPIVVNGRPLRELG
ncbi:MAG: DUF1501 domain-containing protein [Pirellulaceae bacterium]|jgi:hypothetical protein|nr:DUF1501 domain-containing protein [Pirellulaceae bacterium]MDP6556385.1 DUF1501 domain-containing protein [Pirellulaceae bacterium]